MTAYASSPPVSPPELLADPMTPARLEARRQRRVMRISQVGASYALDVVLLLGFVACGVTTLSTALVYLALGAAAIVVFWLAVRRPRAEHYRDPYLALWQMATAASVQVICMYLDPGMGLFFLNVLFIVFAFGALRLTLRETLAAWLLLALAIAPLFRSGAIFVLMPSFSSGASMLFGLSFLLTMARCIVISYFGYRMRVSLYGRNKEADAAKEELERSVAARTAELTAANQELEQANRQLQTYAYAMVHEFRSPLRAINGYAALLGKEYEGRVLDQGGTELIERTRAASNRMAELVDGLSQLATVGRAVARPQPVDLVPIASHIMQAYRGRDAGRGIEWVLPDAIHAVADPELMGAALRILIDNAWKFTARMTGARIEFGVLETDGVREYFVRDNGAGFDRAYADKLFGIFQRLHAGHEFEGNGVGLAVLERIVALHGGQVRAEGAPGQGATFYFTLADSSLGGPPKTPLKAGSRAG